MATPPWTDCLDFFRLMRTLTLEQRVADLERTVETLKRRLDLQTRRFR